MELILNQPEISLEFTIFSPEGFEVVLDDGQVSGNAEGRLEQVEVMLDACVSGRQRHVRRLQTQIVLQPKPQNQFPIFAKKKVNLRHL
jgi:acylphosphatase